MKNFKSIGKEGGILFVCCVIYAILSENQIITLIAIIIPFIIFRLVSRKGDSPILFFAFLLQWSSISIKIFYANYIGEDFIDLHGYPREIITALIASLVGLTSLCLGVHVILRKMNIPEINNFIIHKEDYSFNKLTQIYVICSLAYPVLFALSFTLGGLQQPLSKLIEFKWSVFFLFMIYCFQTKQYKVFMIIAIYEIIMSFTGYFSTFKDYFLALFIGIVMIFGNRIRPKHIIPLSLVVGLGTYFLMIWQYVKPEYRKFLSDGAEQQVSVKSTGESLNKLFELVSEAGSDAITEGMEYTVNRLEYIDFFSAAITQVPANIPHTNGSLWSGAIARIFQPRLLFPNKTIIDDSEKASLYTGQEFYGADRGTSVSLGYFAETYVDFGLIWMHLGLFLFGIVIGYIYKNVIEKSPNHLIGTAMVFPLFFIIFNFETALDKVVGAIIMYYLIYLFIKQFLLKPFLYYIKF